LIASTAVTLPNRFVNCTNSNAAPAFILTPYCLPRIEALKTRRAARFPENASSEES
jgi:hypothetical protein